MGKKRETQKEKVIQGGKYKSVEELVAQFKHQLLLKDYFSHPLTPGPHRRSRIPVHWMRKYDFKQSWLSPIPDTCNSINLDFQDIKGANWERGA